MFEIGDSVVILAPFGDESTPFVITDVQAINASGEIAAEGQPVEFYQYEIEGTYYAYQYVRAA